jgi:hypothetical protein
MRMRMPIKRAAHQRAAWQQGCFIPRHREGAAAEVPGRKDGVSPADLVSVMPMSTLVLTWRKAAAGARRTRHGWAKHEGMQHVRAGLHADAQHCGQVDQGGCVQLQAPTTPSRPAVHLRRQH